MKKIHDEFYFTDDQSLSFVFNDGLLYIENEETQEDTVVLNKQDVKDLVWFIENVVKK